MMVMLLKVIQMIMFLCIAPLLMGWVKMVKCFFQNRRSPSLIQPYRNLLKLFHKQVILPKESSWIFRFTPYIIFCTIVIACFMMPLFFVDYQANSFFAIGDVIVLIGLLALGRFFLVLAGMDIGTTFGGMGSSREMMISSLAEPTALLVMFTLAMITSSTNLSVIIGRLLNGNFIASPSLIFAVLGFAMITLAETGRLPIDNPTTHLELTMTHEAMILEYSGRYLALIEWSSQIKLMLYFVFISFMILPQGIATHISILFFLRGLGVMFLKLLVLGIMLTLIETVLAKMRLFRAPFFLGAAFILSLLALLSHMILGVV